MYLLQSGAYPVCVKVFSDCLYPLRSQNRAYYPLTGCLQTITVHASSKPTAMAASLPYHLTTPTPSRRSGPFSEAASMYSGYLLYSTVRSQRPFFVAKVMHGSFLSIHTVAYLHVLYTAFSASYHKFAKSGAAGIACSTSSV